MTKKERNTLEERLANAAKKAADAKAEYDKRDARYQELKSQVMAEREKKIMRLFSRAYAKFKIADMTEEEFNNFLDGVQFGWSDPFAEDDDSGIDAESTESTDDVTYDTGMNQNPAQPVSYADQQNPRPQYESYGTGNQ